MPFEADPGECGAGDIGRRHGDEFGDVALGGEPGKEARILEDIAGGRGPRGLDAVDGDVAGEIGIDAADHAEQGRLANAGGADQRHGGAGLDGQPQALEDGRLLPRIALLRDVDL